jgi:peptidoglycan/xylan/chitin deacetylase (PgdA/CDA1 family)
MRKIHYLSKYLSYVKLDYFFLKLKFLFVKDIPILTYHRVCDISNIEDYPFDIELISTDTENFSWQMEFIKKHYNPIHLSRIIDYLDDDIALPSNPIVITIDDGFDDVYTNAFPILKGLDIPATLFITTSFLEEEKTIWYERLAHFILQTDYRIVIADLAFEIPASKDISVRRQYYSQLVERLKLVPNGKRIELLNELYEKYGENYYATSIDIRNLSRPLNWEQIVEMSESILEVGSHSLTHPVFTSLTNENLRRELVDSKNILESAMGIKIDSIAYPVGTKIAFDERVKAATSDAAYKLGLTYVEGRNNPKKLDRFALKRVHIDRDIAKHTFICKLALPSIFDQ